MARPLRIQFPGALYHIMCRGNKGNNIFLDDDDRHKFLFLLTESIHIYEATLFAYVLMHNHFHLILRTHRPNVSELMRRFNICYTGWFNYHHGTYGHLYQGRYKSVLVDADNYLLVLSRYIHLNPLRLASSPHADYRSLWHTLLQYSWSTLPGYIKTNSTVDSVDYDFILRMANGRRSYQRFMINGLKKEDANPLDDTKYQMILGSESFVKRIKDRYTESGSSREQPALRKMKQKPIIPDIIINYVSEHTGISRQSLLNPHHNGTARGMLSELLYRFSALKLREIGRLLAIDYSSVYKCRHRLKVDMKKKKETARLYKILERKVKNHLSNV